MSDQEGNKDLIRTVLKDRDFNLPAKATHMSDFYMQMKDLQDVADLVDQLADMNMDKEGN